ncbi:hypothetical protein DIPPA_20316 [Diplonema papillatum]|nr:hypothetical protein DIPPA_20316 [Diplonema papillatum]
MELVKKHTGRANRKCGCCCSYQLRMKKKEKKLRGSTSFLQHAAPVVRHQPAQHHHQAGGRSVQVSSLVLQGYRAGERPRGVDRLAAIAVAVVAVQQIDLRKRREVYEAQWHGFSHPGVPLPESPAARSRACEQLKRLMQR